ncbi:MAG TPA: EamA family transporter [Tangfeifania sp.]|nr:EamA family transporter [Tangfeifania sp.]
MWAIFGLLSAVFLGIYDIFKKSSLNENAVIPVLFFATLTSAVIFIPVVTGSAFYPEPFQQIGLYAPKLTLGEHLQVLLKAAIVISSWILAFFALKNLPISIFAPIRATSPLWTLIGAIIIFQERLNLLQWVGITLTLGFFYLFSTAGKREGIHFQKNKWVFFVIAATMLGAISGLYDKFIIGRIDRIAVQGWFSFYQVAIMLPVLGIFWYPTRKKTTRFRWRWAIPAIGITLVVADFLYFYALSIEDSMISIIAALRRSSVLIAFVLGALIFKEQNLKSKGIFLIGILVGILMITLGSR